MEYVIIGMGLFIAAIGLILTENNAKYLLAGYNMYTAEQRKEFDIKGYVRLFKIFHFVLGGSILVLGLSTYYLIDPDWAGIFIGVYPILGYIWLIYAGNKYYKGAKDKYSKVAIYVLLAAVLLVTAFSYYGFSEDEMAVSNEGLKIEGMYGVDLTKDEIQEIELVESLPKIRSRVHGFSLSSRFKGYFRTEDFEKVKLVVNEKKSPFIRIESSEGLQIYYSASSENTSDIYNEISLALPSKIAD